MLPIHRPNNHVRWLRSRLPPALAQPTIILVPTTFPKLPPLRNFGDKRSQAVNTAALTEGVSLTSTPARKALSTVRLYPALRTRRDRVTLLVHPGGDQSEIDQRSISDQTDTHPPERGSQTPAESRDASRARETTKNERLIHRNTLALPNPAVSSAGTAQGSLSTRDAKTN